MYINIGHCLIPFDSWCRCDNMRKWMHTLFCIFKTQTAMQISINQCFGAKFKYLICMMVLTRTIILISSNFLWYTSVFVLSLFSTFKTCILYYRVSVRVVPLLFIWLSKLSGYNREVVHNTFVSQANRDRNMEDKLPFFLKR